MEGSAVSRANPAASGHLPWRATDRNQRSPGCGTGSRHGELTHRLPHAVLNRHRTPGLPIHEQVHEATIAHERGLLDASHKALMGSGLDVQGDDLATAVLQDEIDLDLVPGAVVVEVRALIRPGELTCVNSAATDALI